MTNRLQVLLDLLQSSPDDSFVLYALAKEYEKADQAQEALAYYLRLKSTDPEYLALYYHLGKLYEDTLEQPQEALDIYQEGIELAKKKGDRHTLAELSNARMNLELTM